MRFASCAFFQARFASASGERRHSVRRADDQERRDVHEIPCVAFPEHKEQHKPEYGDVRDRDDAAFRIPEQMQSRQHDAEQKQQMTCLEPVIAISERCALLREESLKDPVFGRFPAEIIGRAQRAVAPRVLHLRHKQVLDRAGKAALLYELDRLFRNGLLSFVKRLEGSGILHEIRVVPAA